MEQGKATIKSVKKELRLLQKAEEDAASNESARYPCITCIVLLTHP